MCISFGWFRISFFFSFFFFFLFFFYKKKKWSPLAMRFLFPVGLTVNRRGSGFMISQTIRGENTPPPPHTHTHKHSHTFEHQVYISIHPTRTTTHGADSQLRKAARTKGKQRKERKNRKNALLFLLTNILTQM